MNDQEKLAEKALERKIATMWAAPQNWRAWGSWFSWGSPVGLGLFFISIAVTAWILAQAFGW